MSRLILHIGMPKTGTSSIQETFFAEKVLNEHAYADLGVANHGGLITSFFSDNPYAWRGHRVAGRKPKEVTQFNQQASVKLRALCSAKGQQIISGEDVWHMPENALIKLRDFFAPHFDRIDVIGYVRPPVSFITSTFQKLLENHNLAHLEPGSYYPHYRNKFEKFDRVFGQENVKLRLFDSKELAGSDVVVDFCQILGESIPPEKIQRINQSLSLEATAVLFAYRREGPQYAPYRGKARDNNAMVSSLNQFGTRKLRFAGDLITPVLEKHRDDIAWMEQRLGQSLTDQDERDDNSISSVAELLGVAVDQFDALEAYVKQQQHQAEPNPKQLAHWIEKLRTAIAGRNSKGLTPFYGSKSFFTEEQIALMEDELPPVIALRELALAFERHGRIDEASSVIEAAITLRPNAAGLYKLKERIVSRR